MGQTQKVRGVATFIRTEYGDTIVRYHQTDVVRFNTREIILNTGGWNTRTTVTRMNQASNQFGLGYNVSIRKGHLYVTSGGATAIVCGNTFPISRHL